MSKFTTTELFRQAKEQLDIKRCAERYGLTLDRHDKALCPFHNDHHPSLSFKGEYFKCFSCGESGDVFKLVGQLTGITKPIDVLKMLNDEYALNLPLNQKLSVAERKAVQKKKQEREHYSGLSDKFDAWCNYAFRTVSDYTKFLRDWRETYKPNNSDEELHPLFVESLHNLDLYEYISECLITADKTEMKKFYTDYGKEVTRIDGRIKEYRESLS